jgi:hypothetical protein
MLFYLMYASLDDAIDAYADEYSHDVDHDKLFWLDETYGDVFPGDTLKRITKRIDRIRNRVPKRLAYDVSMDAIRTFEPLWRKPGDDERRALPPEVISQVTKSITEFLCAKIGNEPRIAVLTSRLPEILQMTEQDRTSRVFDAIQVVAVQHFLDQEALFRELPVGSAANPVSSFVAGQIVEHGYLLRLLRSTKRQPKEIFDLEPFLTEELRRDGRAPVDFLRSKDDRALQVWRERAQIRQNDIGFLPKVLRELSVPSSLALPGFVRHSHEEWVMLMNHLDLRFDDKKGKYIWTASWRRARQFIEIGASEMAMNVIDRSGLTLGTVFISLFWKDYAFIGDEKKVSHELTRKISVSEQLLSSEFSKLEKAFKAVYRQPKR